jgi:hypothetical protein
VQNHVNKESGIWLSFDSKTSSIPAAYCRDNDWMMAEKAAQAQATFLPFRIGGCLSWEEAVCLKSSQEECV